MMRNRKVWGVLGLLLALVVVVGYGQPQPPLPIPVPEPSLDVYAVRLEKEIHIFITLLLLLQGQVLTAPHIAESITAELQDRSAKTLATQRFTNISLAGTTQLIMAAPFPPPPPPEPDPWLLKVTAVVGGKMYTGETTVLAEHPIPPPELLAAPPTKGWVKVGPPFHNCGRGRNWASSGYQYCDRSCTASYGCARLLENGTLCVTGEGWDWFISTTYSYSLGTYQIRVVGSIKGEIEKPGGQPYASVTLYAFVKGYSSAGQLTRQIGGVVWMRDWDGVFDESFNRTFSGSLPSGTTFVKAYIEVRARAKDRCPWGANGWARVDELRLTDVSVYLP